MGYSISNIYKDLAVDKMVKKKNAENYSRRKKYIRELYGKTGVDNMANVIYNRSRMNYRDEWAFIENNGVLPKESSKRIAKKIKNIKGSLKEELGSKKRRKN